MYFTQEGQFRNYFEKAARSKGVTGEMLLQQLERRLDNVVYRLGFAVARRQARQLVRHGHVQVNGRKVNIPSYPGRGGRRDHDPRKQPQAAGAGDWPRNSQPSDASDLAGSRPRQLSRPRLSLPKREEINLPINEQLIVELYSK